MQALREDPLDRYGLALRMKNQGMTNREIATGLAIPVHRVSSYLRVARERDPVCDCGGNHSAYVMDMTLGAGHAVSCPVRIANPFVAESA